jgi:hypothetical protein
MKRIMNKDICRGKEKCDMIKREKKGAAIAQKV